MITCRQCKFFSIQGQCRRYAPMPNESGTARWPFLANPDTDWCGDGERSEEEPPPAKEPRRKSLFDGQDVQENGIPSELQVVIDWWNEMHSCGIVGSKVEVSRGTAGVCKAWDRRNRKELRSLVREYVLKPDGRAVLRQKIAEQGLGEKSWFGFEQLFSFNKTGVPMLEQVIRGAYRDFATNGKATQTTGGRSNAQVYSGSDD